MEQLGLSVLLNQLFGSDYEKAKEDFQKSLGKTIKNINISEEELKLSFEDGSHLIFWDDGQSCCEHRYMHTDDTLDYYQGSTFNGVDVKSGPEEEDEYGDCKESEFLIVTTSKGQFTVVNYNEHNGYYGGFSILCRLVEPD